MGEDLNLPPAKKPKLNEEDQNSQDGMEEEEGIYKMETEIDFTENDDKYSNFVTNEELEKLREFKVLDEVKSNDEDSNDDDSDSSDGKSEGLPEEEIEKMLEEDLPENFKGVPKPKERPYVTRQKIVLEEKGVNHFDVLPLDWMMVRHYSGMPVYMHRATRVCTLSKPYCLGKGNTRRHEIPISAIPCLSYRKALEEEEKQKEIDRRIQEQIKNGTWVTNIKKKENSISNILINVSADNSQGKLSKCPFSEIVYKEKETKLSEDSKTNISEYDSVRGRSKELKIDDSDNLAETKKISLANENNIDDEQYQTKAEEPLTNEQVNAKSEQENIVKEDQESAGDDQEFAKDVQVTNEQPDTVNFDSLMDIPLNRQPVVLPGGIVMPPPRVETVNAKSQHLTHEQMNDYCKKLFKFKTVNIMHFQRWADRRKYTRARKALQFPTLPEGTKLITIPAQPVPGHDNGGKTTKRDCVMNMNGRSYLSVFHEYVRRALQKQPVYEFKQLENASSPYQATVYIGGMQYGVGQGSSKRQAKSAAARASIHILIPEMKDELDVERRGRGDDAEDRDFSFFDCVGIEDPRITEFCAATCEPSPHAILRTCLLRNFGAGDRHIHTEMKKLEFQNIELTMKVGKHTATVVCKNKKTAKQRASQAILQALHPHVRSWGSLLRLYGSRSVKSCKEKKLEEQQITLLQDKARHNEPNYAVLEKLRHEMRKLRDRDAAVVPIGTLLLRHDLPQHSGSNLNNVDL